ncbi:MAG: helix-turn-helix domain-containing protein [Oscillospiraceae bacterium]|nr:helix-turn-helix domain-containing protein [Oscillospiraceae bacterium]
MVSETIKNLRRSHGLTQAQVAECLGLERSTYAYYEGGRVPGVEILLRLCGLYKITLEYLITGEEGIGRAYLRDSNASMEHVPHLLLSDEEKKLVLLFRLCEDKNAVIEYARLQSLQE